MKLEEKLKGSRTVTPVYVTEAEKDAISVNDVVVIHSHQFLDGTRQVQKVTGVEPKLKGCSMGNMYLFPNQEAAENFKSLFSSRRLGGNNMIVSQLPTENTFGYAKGPIFYIQPHNDASAIDSNVTPKVLREKGLHLVRAANFSNAELLIAHQQSAIDAGRELTSDMRGLRVYNENLRPIEEQGLPSGAAQDPQGQQVRPNPDLVR